MTAPDTDFDAYPRSPEPPLHPSEEWETERYYADDVPGIEWDNLRIHTPDSTQDHCGYRLDMTTLHRVDGELVGSVLGSMYGDSPHEWPIVGLVYEQIATKTRQYETPLPKIYLKTEDEYVGGWKIADIEQETDGSLTAVIAIPDGESHTSRRISANELVWMQLEFLAKQRKGAAVTAATVQVGEKQE